MARWSSPTNIPLSNSLRYPYPYICTWVTYLSVAATARIHFHKKSPSSGNLPFLASKNAHTCETLYCTAMSWSWVRHSHISKGVLHSAPIDPQRNLLWKGRGYRPQPPETLNQIDLSFSKEDQLSSQRLWHLFLCLYIDLNDCQFFRIMEWLMFFFLRPPLTSMVFQWFCLRCITMYNCHCMFFVGPTIGFWSFEGNSGLNSSKIKKERKINLQQSANSQLA